MIRCQIAMLGLLPAFLMPICGAPAGELPAFSVVRNIVDRELQKFEDFQKNDLISKGFAEPVFKELDALGWKVTDQKEITQLMLPDGHTMVGVFQTDEGLKFMRKVSGYELIYDRLDRISEQTGGKELIRDLAKLPDGYRYARPTPARGAPDLLDFLPKNRDGKKRSIKDYDKPTGKLYTVEQFVERLKESHDKAKKAATP